MSFLLRVMLPDRPGALGLVATALGTVEADIISVDVIERGPGYAIDDLVIELPAGRLPDSLVTAASRVEGARVESIRPYAAVLDPTRELELIDRLVARPNDPLNLIADSVSRIFRAGWTMVLSEDGKDVDGAPRARVLARSAAAPELDTLTVRWWPVTQASALDPAIAETPGAWDGANTELAVTPMGAAAVLIGRPAMRWLPGELARLSHLAGILASVL